MKVLIAQVAGSASNDSVIIVSKFSGSAYTGDTNIQFSFSGVVNSDDYRAAVITAILAWSVTNGYGLTADDIIWSPVAKFTQSAMTRSIVTGTGATGFQISSSKDVMVNYSTTIVSTASIAGSASGTVVLEICPTNSATAGDWIEVSRFTNGQALSLAITLQSVQTLVGNLSGFVPKGYYAKLRSINNAGTPSFTFSSGQEVTIS